MTYEATKIVDFSETTVFDYHTAVYTFPEIKADIFGFLRPLSLSVGEILKWRLLLLFSCSFYGRRAIPVTYDIQKVAIRH